MNGSRFRQAAPDVAGDREREACVKRNPRSSGGAPAVFRAFLRLRPTSFGGPIAHLGYFRAELAAISQFLPGPASSQTGFGIGLARADLPGGLAAWCDAARSPANRRRAPFIPG
jgi:hypothetical protein